jgi:hypothetical protein
MSEIVQDINYLPRLEDLGLTNSNLVQVNCSRSIGVVNDSATEKKDNWLAGVMDFSWSCADKKMVSIARSYFRTEVEVTVKDKVTGNYRAPRTTDNFTLAENFMNNMISNSYFYIGSQSVCSQSQYHGQAAALRIRLNKSFNWLQSVGKSAYFLDPDFSSRQLKICEDYKVEQNGHLALGYDNDNKMEVADGKASESEITLTQATGAVLPVLSSVWGVGDKITYLNAGSTVVGTVRAVDDASQTLTIERVATLAAAFLSIALPSRIRDYQQTQEVSDGRNTLMVLFQLPLACFSNQQCYPSSSYRFSIFPKSDKTGAFEYNTPSESTNAPLANVSLLVKNLYFFAYTFEAEKPFANGTYYLSYNSLDIQAKKLNKGTNQTTTHTFNIPSSTLGIATALMDQASGTANALNCPPSVFKGKVRDSTTKDAETDNLTSLQLVYSNISKPVQNYTTKLTTGTQEILQRYYSTQSDANMEMIGGESFSDWLGKRGPLYYHSFIRNSDDKSTNLQIQLQMAEITEETQLMVASFYRKLCEITVVDGICNMVRSLAV